LLQTKTEVPFDSIVESLSNAFFAFYPLPILLVATIYLLVPALLVPAVRSAEGVGWYPFTRITKFARFRNPAPTPLKPRQSPVPLSFQRTYFTNPPSEGCDTVAQD
jgi:hypothetical protein